MAAGSAFVRSKTLCRFDVGLKKFSKNLPKSSLKVERLILEWQQGELLSSSLPEFLIVRISGFRRSSGP
jgi:hypothetical protein